MFIDLQFHQAVLKKGGNGLKACKRRRFGCSLSVNSFYGVKSSRLKRDACRSMNGYGQLELTKAGLPSFFLIFKCCRVL